MYVEEDLCLAFFRALALYSVLWIEPPRNKLYLYYFIVLYRDLASFLKKRT